MIVQKASISAPDTLPDPALVRPSGVINDDIRANTNLRIALRVTDAAESTDVVDTRDAADIGRSTPGRAVVRIGAGAVALGRLHQMHAPAEQ